MAALRMPLCGTSRLKVELELGKLRVDLCEPTQTTRINDKIIHFAGGFVHGLRLSNHYRTSLYVLVAGFHRRAHHTMPISSYWLGSSRPRRIRRIS